MRIKDVRAYVISKPLTTPLRVARGDMQARTTVVVLVETDEGILGVGEAIGIPPMIKAAIEQYLKKMVVGEDPFDVEKLWTRMFVPTVYWELKGSYLSAISGIEMALWDIMGKAQKAPAYKLLGGKYRDRVKAYASDLFWEGKEAMASKAKKFVEQGFSIVKTHVGRDPVEDVERVEAIREAVGDDVEIMVDINCGFDRATAYRFAEAIEDCNIFWFEEPLPPYDVEGYKELKSRIDIPIAAGENEFTLHGFKLLCPGIDYAMPDIARTGGMLEVKKISDYLRTQNIICSPHVFSSGILLAATLQLMACTPNCDLLEYDTTGTAIRDELLAEPLELAGEFVKIPDTPGLGVKFDEKRLREVIVG